MLKDDICCGIVWLWVVEDCWRTGANAAGEGVAGAAGHVEGVREGGGGKESSQALYVVHGLSNFANNSVIKHGV